MPVAPVADPFTEIASGLQFPEGPVALPDGSVAVVEIFGERATLVHRDGSHETIAELPGGPNGMAVGPDGAFYVCNNGGAFTPVDLGGVVVLGRFDPSRYRGGSIQRVTTDGEVTTLYTECDGHPLRGPNDLVMDGHGGFYFTDHGIVDRTARTADLSGIYYATCDGSSIREVAFPVHSPNGIGLSPDSRTLYYAETFTARLFQRRIAAPGELEPASDLDPRSVLASLPGLQYADSLAVDGEGWVCVATLVNGGITSVSPDGASIEFLATDDPITTNLAFGGPELRTAYLTLSGTGRLVSVPWPRNGLRLAHQ
jgi:gluconolactonase